MYGHKVWSTSRTGIDMFGHSGWCRCCKGLKHTFVKKTIPLDEIKTDLGITPIDKKHVDLMAEDIAERGMIQPIIVTGAYYLIDGIHRFMAHKKLGLHDIPCFVVVLENGGTIENETL